MSDSMFVYPLDAVGAVTITQGDFARLEPEEFLNDTLIEYGLKWVLSSVRTNRELTESAQANLPRATCRNARSGPHFQFVLL